MIKIFYNIYYEKLYLKNNSNYCFYNYVEFTIGRTLNKITSQADILLTREGRKEMVNSIKSEMTKAIKKENFLKQDERVLINNSLIKLKMN